MFEIFAPFGADFYKTGHPFMFSKKLTELYGNMTARGDKFALTLQDFDHKVLWVGFTAVLQYMLIDNWNNTFFNREKDVVIKKYKRMMDRALGLNKVPTWKLEALHDLGYLPIRVKSLPEGSRVDLRVPLWTAVSTMEEHAWIEQYLETQISSESWLPLTSATTAFEFRRLFEQYAILTGADREFVKFQGHDFSMRGMETMAATISGAAHLTVFRGTDTITAIDFLETYYPDPADPFIGGSVPATEHAVSSSNIIEIAAALEKHGEWNGWSKQSLNPRQSDSFFGRGDRSADQAWVDACPILEMAETAYLKYMLTEGQPEGIFSYVADTYDFFAVVTRISAHLKSEILARNGKVVFRPDSGDPVKIMIGDPDAQFASPEWWGAIRCLYKIFDGPINQEGFHELDSHVGTIYGDSISLVRAEQILKGLFDMGFASTVWVAGIGSYTYQYVTRDTFGTAIKATHAVVAGEDHELFKDPKTDSGLKKSARGFLRVEKENGHYVLYDRQTREQEAQGELKVVFENSKLINPPTLTEVRDRIEAELKLVLDRELVQAA